MNGTVTDSTTNETKLKGKVSGQEITQFVIGFSSDEEKNYFDHVKKDLLRFVKNKMISRCLKQTIFKEKIGMQSELYTRNAKNSLSAIPVTESRRLREIIADAYKETQKKKSTSQVPTIELSLGLINIANNDVVITEDLVTNLLSLSQDTHLSETLRNNGGGSPARHNGNVSSKDKSDAAKSYQDEADKFVIQFF